MELRDLEYFAVVAEELHFAKAAARLHVVPAAVSQRIKELEQTLEVPLFTRTSRRVVLTSPGEMLLPVAQRALRAARDVTTTAVAIRSGTLGDVHIGFAPGSSGFIDELTRLLAESGADGTVIAESMWSMTALDALEAGTIDLALVRDPLPSAGVVSAQIASYRDDHVAVATTHAAASSDRIDLRTFEGQGFLLNERDTAPGVHDATVRFFAEHAVAPVWRHHRLQEHEQQLALVAAGAASALVHSHRADIIVPGVVIRPLEQEGPLHRFLLVMRQEEQSVAAVKLFALARDLPSFTATE